MTRCPAKSEAVDLFDLGPTHLSIDFPDPIHNPAEIQEQYVRDMEIDPHLYYPADVDRDLIRVFPKGFKIEIPKMIGKKLSVASQRPLQARARARR